MSLKPYIKKAKENFNNEGNPELLVTLGLPSTSYILASGALQFTVTDQNGNEQQKEIRLKGTLYSGQERKIIIPIEKNWKTVEFNSFKNVAGTMPLNGLSVKGQHRTLFLN